jgi:hypothetical protein
MLSLDQLGSNTKSSRGNKIGTLESMLSGVASGLIAIPKGFFSLGASIMDLGVNSGKAAAVEQWFDDLTEFDEKAEATAAGKITELLVNIGIPGGLAFKSASGLAKTAMIAGKNKKYLKLDNPSLVGAADEALELTAKGKTRQFIAGALGGGVAEGVFVGDAEKVGTFGDLIGGPTSIDRSGTDVDATREILNRIKFGTEGALFTGILGGAGTVIKKITNRNKGLDVANSQLDEWIDNVAAKFRARSGKTQELFNLERESLGLRSQDTNVAQRLSRNLEVNIDKMFPFFRNIGNKQTVKEKSKFLNDLNEALLSGEAKIDDVTGATTYGAMDEAAVKKVRDTINKFATSKEMAKELDDQIMGSLTTMRDKWAELFETLGGTLTPEDLKGFKSIFGNKFKNYLGATYDIFQDQSLIPFLRYKPAAQSIENAKKVFKESWAEANPELVKQGKVLEDLEAEQYVADILKPQNIGLPKGIRMDKPSQAYFTIPDFFVNRTVLDDVVNAKGRLGGPRINVEQLASEADQKVFNELFGKNTNPMITMITGMSKLSMITRRNVLYKDIFKKNEEVIANWMAAADKTTVPQPMFARTEDEARLFFGNADYRRIEPVDQAQRLAVSTTPGATTPFSGIENTYYARNGVAEAIEGTSFATKDRGNIGRLYDSLILYPKAASQIAKTILSPVTHLRNFVSAGAFAAANGILPAADPAAIKQAYQALQTGLKGTRQQNELYEELLALGVVNRNVRIGDISKLMEDVGFGSSMTSDKGMRLLLKPLSKLKSTAQDLYTAEDDFWKIYSWAIEKNRIEKAFEAQGIIKNTNASIKRNGVQIKYDDNFLKREAADIVRNNIPNYDYVSDFVKGIRKLPIGNFVSFPAEIARTGTNIVRRALREINETIEITDGAGKVIKRIKPLEGIGYKRLFGFTTTVAAIPVGTAAAFQAIYDVTDEEREAIRRFAAQWSKNSTLLPIKQKDGSFKYIDFSHANAYDTLLRPLQTVINSVQDGRTDENGMMDDFAKGLFTAMAEFGQPFISEAIWTEAVSDIIMRGGRTREGFQVYSPEDTPGDRNSKIIKHLVRAQMPFSLDQLKRLDRSIESRDVLVKGKFDEYGQDFEFGDEFQGLFGFRAVKVNPERAMNFKVADYQKGVRDSRSLFTRVALKGGPIEPREIVDAYINANRALFGVKKTLKGDMDAARLLNISDDGFYGALDRVSNREANAIDDNVFIPYNISIEVRNAFADNAARIGVANPFDKAADVIGDLEARMADLSLGLAEFPVFENPLQPIMQDTPLGPQTLNLPSIDANAVSAQVQGSNFSNLTTQQKLDLLFGGN